MTEGEIYAMLCYAKA